MFIYLVATCLVCVVIGLSLRRSAFGILLAATLIWFLIGACLYPLFDLLRLVERGEEVSAFIALNGEPGLMTATHILLMATGMACGYLYRPHTGVSERAVRWIGVRLAAGDDLAIWRASVLLGIGAYILYFSLVGLDTALINAAAARGGDFEGFGEKDAYLFIKTVAAVGLVSICFVSLALLRKSWWFSLLYFVLLAMAYTNSISRNLLLYGGLVPLLVYVRLRGDLRRRGGGKHTYVMALALIPLALLVLNYGKVMGHYISAYMSGDYYSLTEEVGEISQLDVLLNNFGFQWASVQAGIDHFLATARPFFPQEHFLAALFGAIPSRVLNALGLDALYYGKVSATLACVNSQAFGYVECTVPPLSVGYSAYLLPGAGGFLVGYVWLRIYVAIERLWLALQQHNWHKLWIPYFMWSLVVNFFTFIPSSLAVSMAQLLWLVLLSNLRLKPLYAPMPSKR